MKISNCLSVGAVVCTLTCASLFFASELSAQSSVILDAQSNGTGGIRSFAQTGFPPSTLSQTQRRWKAILDQPHPEIDDRAMKIPRLIEELNRLGIPVTIHGSALEDEVDIEDDIILGTPNQSLRIRINAALEHFNAVLTIQNDRIMIISLDVEADPEYFLAVTYDVTTMNVDTYQLTETIMQSVDQDGWEDTNGEATIVAFQANHRTLLVMSAPYRMHLDVRRLLNGMHGISGAPSSVAPTVPGSLLSGNSSSPYGPVAGSGSRAIEVPNGNSNSGSMSLRRQPFQQHQRGSGIGGFGGGGGVF